MRRRDFIKIIAGTAATWPFAVLAQQSLPLIGFMSSRSSKDSEPHSAAFLRGLNEAGYVPEQNVKIEYRWADGHYERLREIAAELVRLRPKRTLSSNPVERDLRHNRNLNCDILSLALRRPRLGEAHETAGFR